MATADRIELPQQCPQCGSPLHYVSAAGMVNDETRTVTVIVNAEPHVCGEITIEHVVGGAAELDPA